MSMLGRACALILVASSVFVSACWTCPGTEVCGTDWRLQVVGTVVDLATGAPVPDTRMDVTFSGASGSETMTVFTDANGRWSAKGRADCCDKWRASVVVSPPGLPSYYVPDFPVRTLRTVGDAVLLGDWTSRPYVRYAATALHNNVERMPSAALRFVPLTGVPLAGPIDVVADGLGTFRIDAEADRLGDAIGTLTVTHSLLAAPKTIVGFRISVSHHYRLPMPVSLAVYD